MAISLVLADTHPLVLYGLETLFRLQPDFKVLARCRDAEETLRALRTHSPDVLILDARMSDGDGWTVLTKIKKEQLPSRVVLLSAALDEDEVVRAIRLGVRGVVLKEMEPELLVRCIRKVHAGGQWWETRSVGRALDRLLRSEAGAREIAGILTAREIEITRMVANGRRNREIADQLSLSEGTIKTHLHNIYQKLNVGSRLQLTLLARDRGLVDALGAWAS
jgi:DNA-binding NarL/FixJ family response regulator